jgi:hypothetical protein
MENSGDDDEDNLKSSIIEQDPRKRFIKVLNVFILSLMMKFLIE